MNLNFRRIGLKFGGASYYEERADAQYRLLITPRLATSPKPIYAPSKFRDPGLEFRVTLAPVETKRVTSNNARGYC